MSDSYFNLQTRFADNLADQENKLAVAQFEGSAEQVERRLSLYRGNVLAARQKALAAAYPVSAKIVGEEFFRALTRVYMQDHPSVSGDLNEFGAELAEFLRHFAGVAELPYLPDVAQLEWQVHRAHYAAEHAPLDLAQLMAVPPAQQVALQFTLRPDCALLYSLYPIERIWTIHQDDYQGKFEVEFDQGPYYILVHRPQWRAQVQSLDAARYALLDALSRGLPLGGALEAALDADPGFDLGHALAWVLEQKLLAGCHINGEPR